MPIGKRRIVGRMVSQVEMAPSSPPGDLGARLPYERWASQAGANLAPARSRVRGANPLRSGSTGGHWMVVGPLCSVS